MILVNMCLFNLLDLIYLFKDLCMLDGSHLIFLYLLEFPVYCSFLLLSYSFLESCLCSGPGVLK